MQRGSSEAESSQNVSGQSPVRLLHMALALVLLGVLVWIGPGGSFSFAVICFLLALAPVAAYALRERERMRQEHLAVAKEQQREDLKQARRIRHTLRRETHRAAREARAAAELRLIEQRAEQRRQRVEAEAQARSSAAERDREAADLVRSLAALDDANYAQEALAWLADRGYRVEPAPTDPEGGFFLRNSTGALQGIAHIAGREAHLTSGDIAALEEIRIQLEVEVAYLFSLNFTPEAARAVRGLQVQLVDAHMLAMWRVAHGRTDVP